jgi:hypothetical protein
VQREVVVNDTMQSGYRYFRSAPMGARFHPEFKPDLTPAGMLSLGVFCGNYMTDCRDEFPAEWFEGARLAESKADCSLNYFGVRAGSSLREWRAKGWIHPDDPRGWFQWYCRYYRAAGWTRKTRARSRGGKRFAATPRKSAAIASRAIHFAVPASARRCCNGHMIAACSRDRRVPER